ncbi:MULTISPECIES: CvpA family protein [Aerococcus]|uniref:CvpA family protein n=1 Tax=Aerococcus viridans TaxID=1377 RepID=A0A2N6UEJ8_9LACT|nr:MULTISPECIES: CvpA family protein [Aerococcus]OFU48765.1 CvpA family protein [Aerococcus sp. HMSC10H05]PMC80023.1 CvpA family protein [Aerococcus viridans]
MISFFILLFFILSVAIGIYRGALIQGIQSLGLLIAYLFALLFYQNLVDIVSLWVPYVGFDIENTFAYYPVSLLQNMDIIYFRLVAILIIILIIWLLTKLLTYSVRDLKFTEMDIQWNGILGGLFGFFSAWFWAFFILIFMTVLTFEAVQSSIEHSTIANFIILNTPILSRQVFNILLQGLGNLPF